MPDPIVRLLACSPRPSSDMRKFLDMGAGRPCTAAADFGHFKLYATILLFMSQSYAKKGHSLSCLHLGSACSSLILMYRPSVRRLVAGASVSVPHLCGLGAYQYCGDRGVERAYAPGQRQVPSLDLKSSALNWLPDSTETFPLTRGMGFPSHPGCVVGK